MTHISGHVRRAFAEWVADGFPEMATVEQQYVPTPVPAEDMLRRFVTPVTCSDRLPADLAHAVMEHIGADGWTPPMTYAAAAFLLLAYRNLPSLSMATLVPAIFPNLRIAGELPERRSA